METTLKFTLIADTTQFNAALKTSTTQVTALNAASNNMGDGVEKASNRAMFSMSKVKGVIASVITSLGVIGGMMIFTNLVKQGADFDRAFVGITKTVNASAEEFNNLRVQILNMSAELPFAATEIAKVGQIAGQLGIQAKDIAEFTRVVLDLSVAADDLDTEQAALTLARLGKLAGIAVGDTKNLAASIVQLSNVSATTEGEISALALRIMGAARAAGISAPDVLALSASLTQLGIRADAGGTSMSKAIQMMRGAVESGGPELEKFAELAGMSAESFARTWKEKPIQAINAFVSGLGTMIAQGGNATEALKELGLQDIRVSRSILSAASAQGELNRLIKESTTAYQEGTASQKEAEKFYADFENQLTTLWNVIVKISIEIWDNIKPAFVALAWAIKETVDWLSFTKGLATVILGPLTALGASVQMLSTAWGNLGEMWDALVSGDMARLQNAMEATRQGIILQGSTVTSTSKTWQKYLEDVDKSATAQEDMVRAVDNVIVEYTNLKRAGGDVSLWFTTNRAELEKLVAKHAEFADGANSNIDILKELYEELSKTAAGTKNLDEETAKLIAKFKSTLRPMEDTLAEINALKSAYSESQILAVYGEEIIKNTEAQLANGEAVSKDALAWYEWAKALKEAKDPAKALDELSASLDLVSQGMGTTNEYLEKNKTVFDAAAQASNDFGKTFPKGVGMAFDDMKDPANPISKFVKEFEAMQNAIPNVTYMISELTRQNIPAAAQAKMLASELAAAEAASEALGVELPTEVKNLIELGKAGKKAESDMKRVQRMVDSIVSQTFSDFTNAISDAIVDWKGFGDSLVDIAKNFGKALIRVMMTELFSPLLGIMKGIGQGLAGLISGQGFNFSLGGSLLGTATNTALGAGGSSILGALGLGGGAAAAAGSAGSVVFTGAGGTMVGTMGLPGAAGSSSLMGSLGGFFTNPITAVVGGGLLAGLLGYKAFTNTPSEAFVKEISRDFGGVKVGEDVFKNLLGGLGISEKQAAPIRKDLASSPVFLQISYEAAKAQGKVDSFMKSLEAVKTSWGTFNFRSAFQQGLDTGNWTALNNAFEGAFKQSKALTNVFGSDLSPLLMEVSEEADTAADKFANVVEALDQLRARPQAVADTMNLAVDAIARLREEGATDSEITTLLGNDLAELAKEATSLNVAIPSVISDLLGLGQAAEEPVGQFDALLASLEDLRQQPTKVSDSLQTMVGAIDALRGAGATNDEILTLLGEDINSLVASAVSLGVSIPESVQQLYDMANAVEEVDPAVLRLNASMESGKEAATGLMEASALLGAEITGFTDQLQTQGKTAVEAQALAWSQYGDQLIEHYNTQKTLGLGIDSTVQSMIDWAIETEKITTLEGGLVAVVEDTTEAVTESAVALTKFQEAVRQGGLRAEDLLDSSAMLASNIEGFTNTLIEKGVPAVQAQNIVWGEFGTQMMDIANKQIKYGLTVDDNVLSLLDWAVASGKIQISEAGLYEIIKEGTAIIEDNTEAVEARTAAYIRGFEASQELIASSTSLSDQIQGFSEGILAAGVPAVQAQTYVWGKFGDTILETINTNKELKLSIDWRLQQMADWAVQTGKVILTEEGLYEVVKNSTDAIDENTDAIEKHTEAYLRGASAALSLLSASYDLGEQLQGYGQTLLDSGIPATQAQEIAWNQLGSAILANINLQKESGLQADWRIQQAIDWAVQTGKVILTEEGLYEVVKNSTDAIDENTGALDNNNAAITKSIELLGRQSDAFDKGYASVSDFLNTSVNLADQLQGFGQGLLDSGIPAVEAQNLIWKQFGDTITEHITEQKSLGREIDWRILQMYEWAKANGYVEESMNGLNDAIEGTEAQLSAGEKAWLNIKNSLLDVNEVYQFGAQILRAGNVDLNNQEEVLRAQAYVWEVYGSKILDTAEIQQKVYGQIDGGIKNLLQWALASDTVTDSIKDQIRALLGLEQAYGELAQVMARNPNDIIDSVVGKGGILNPNGQASFANTAYYYAQEAAAILKEMGVTPDFAQLKSDIVNAASKYGDPNKFELVAEAIAAMTPNMQFKDRFLQLSGIPSFQTGTDFVPDDTLAYLHKGERVVPASQNGMVINNTFEIKAMDGSDVERVVRHKIIPELRKQSQLRRY